MKWLWGSSTSNGETKAALNLLNVNEWEKILGQYGNKAAAYYMAALRKRATWASIIPRRVMDAAGNEVEEKDLPFRFDMSGLMWRSMYALDVYGSAYVGLQGNLGGKLHAVHWLDPRTIQIMERPTGGINHFLRSVAGEGAVNIGYDVVTDTAEDMAFVFSLGMAEHGPGFTIDEYAKLPAELLQKSDLLMKGLFDRGAINHHVAFATGMPSKSIMAELRSRLNRVFFRGTDGAHGIEVLNGEKLSFERIGTDPKDLALEAVDKGNRRDISAITDTPEMIIEPGAQINRASLDRITSNYINYSIMPPAENIVREWNRQILEPQGYELVLDAQKLSVEQVEEKNRMQAWALWVSGGGDPETGAALLGFDIPEGMPIMAATPPPVEVMPVSDVATDDVEDNDGEPSDDSEKSAELAALKRFVAKGKHLKRVFKSDVLSQNEIDDVIMGAAVAQDTPFIKNDRVRNKWEREALEVFRRAYLNQWNRTRRVIRQSERDELLQALEQLFSSEPQAVAREVRPFFDSLMTEVSAAALREVGASADPDPVIQAIINLSNDESLVFANRITETSRRMTYSIVESWLLDDGATIGQLTDRLSRIWTGPRPDAAATTESTRLVAESRRVAWDANGAIWGYEVRTKNDGRVRPTHKEVANNGPYPLSDTQHLPPINGDVNCRCTIVAVVEPPT